MAAILGSSDEKTNGYKLMRLIVDGGTEALRNAFRNIHSGNLQVVLSCRCSSISTPPPCNHHILLYLKNRLKIITDDQWEKLYPPTSNPPNINDFDITLLCILLRNICGLWPPRDSRWDKMPYYPDGPNDFPGADIVRIRLFRNSRFAHIPNISVSAADFKDFWTEISSPLVRLWISQSEIDRLENEQCGEEEVERVLNKWKKCETEIMSTLNEMKDDVSEVKDDVNETKDDMNKMRNDVNETKDDVSKMKDDVNEMKDDVNETKDDVSKMKDDVNEMKGDVYEMKDDVNEIKRNVNEIKDDVNEMKDNAKRLKIDEECRLDDVINKNLVSCNFQREIDLYYEKFTSGTREWVFEQFLTWFNDETSKFRAFVITGLAGMGKSVIAAVICKRFAEHVDACHFFQYNNSRYNNCNILLQSLAWQLCQVVPAYKEALIKKLSGNIGQSLNNTNIEGLFSILFKEPFSGIADPGKQILIVLDAVDESEYGRHELANLISNYLHTLPSYIRFLITTRPEGNIIDKFKKLIPLYIKGNDERNLSDLKLVLQKSISDPSACTKDLIDDLAKKSDGLMLYAFFLSEIYNDESSLFSIDSLPKGIGEYYERYFRRLQRELDLLKISEDKFFSLLSALAVAKEPLPEAFLVTLLGLEDSRRTMRKVRKAISSLFVISEDNVISFFHKSVRDWLVDCSEHDYSVDVQDGHKNLFDLCVIKLNKLKQRDVRDVVNTDVAVKYSIKYWIPLMLNVLEDPGKFAHFVDNYAADLEVMFASVLVDVDYILNNIADLTNHKMYNHVSDNTRATVSRLAYLIRRFSLLLGNYPSIFLQTVVNEGGGELSSKASFLLQNYYKDITFLEFFKKDRKNDALQAHCFLSGRLLGIDISPKHDYIVCCYEEGGIELFSLVTCTSVWKIPDYMVKCLFFALPIRHNCFGHPVILAHCIVFHPRNSSILPGRLDKALTLEGTFTTGTFQCDERSAEFTNCCFSSDNSRMVTLYGFNLIVWNVLSGTKEKCISCKILFSFSFTTSGNYFGTIDMENVFNVYDVTNNYTLFKSVKIESLFPVEIVSTFKENSWFCSVRGYITVIHHDLSYQETLGSLSNVVLPSNVYCSHELNCFVKHPKMSWFSKVKKILSTLFLSSNCVLRYISIKDKSVLIYSRISNAMHVFSLEGLEDTEERTPNLIVFLSNISACGNFVYLYKKSEQRFIICELDSNKIKKQRLHSNQLDIAAVRDGVILLGENGIPEHFNTDLTQCLASFNQLARVKRLMSVSDELIACIYQSYVTFFNVFTKKIQSTIIFNENVFSVHACSSKYHVLAQIESGGSFLWKDGTKVAGWEDILSMNTSLKRIYSAEFSPQGNRLALSKIRVKKIFIYDVVSIQFLAEIPIYPENFDLICLTFFGNENLVCSSTNHMLFFINVDRGEILTCIDVGDIPEPIAVSCTRSIVFAGLDYSERFELIKVWLPR